MAPSALKPAKKVSSKVLKRTMVNILAQIVYFALTLLKFFHVLFCLFTHFYRGGCEIFRFANIEIHMKFPT